jgi:carbonic anhydrase
MKMLNRYSGSLTTPPCDEDIAWNVGCRPLTVSVETYRRVKDVLKFNARFAQNIPGEINLLENVANELCGSA